MTERRLILGALNFHASAVKERGHRQTHTHTHTHIQGPWAALVALTALCFPGSQITRLTGVFLAADPMMCWPLWGQGQFHASVLQCSLWPRGRLPGSRDSRGTQRSTSRYTSEIDRGPSLEVLGSVSGISGIIPLRLSLPSAQPAAVPW